MAEQVTKTATDAVGSATNTVGSATKKTPLRADFERKANALARKKPSTKIYDDYEDDDDSDPEFIPTARHGKHRIFPMKVSRIADRPVSDKESTMSIKIELDLEVEVEIYARVKGDVAIGLM